MMLHAEEVKAPTEAAPTPEQQRLLISSLVNIPMQEGQQYGVINAAWYRLWKNYVHFDEYEYYSQENDPIFPCPIDNSSLIEGMYVMKNLNSNAFNYMLGRELYSNLNFESNVSLMCCATDFSPSTIPQLYINDHKLSLVLSCNLDQAANLVSAPQGRERILGKQRARKNLNYWISIFPLKWFHISVKYRLAELK